MSITYLNYLKQNIYFNALTSTDETNYVGKTYDITTEIQSIKNYLGVDSTLQRNVFMSQEDLTDYYLVIDDSQFLKDQTVFEVTDIYFSDISDTTRQDNSVLFFTLDELIYDYTKQDNTTILHFKIKINKQPDVTDNLSFSLPLFLDPNMPQIANDLILQYNIFFIQIDFFNEHSMMMAMKEYIQTTYSSSLNSRLALQFTGQNNIMFIDYASMLKDKIISSISDALGNTQNVVSDSENKHYQQDCTTYKLLRQSTDFTMILDLFWDYAIDFYSEHIDYTIDPYGGFSTDSDLYMVSYDISRFVDYGNYSADYLNVLFVKFLLIRNNIYTQKFTMLHDGTEQWNDLIKFKVQNVLPNQTYTFDYTNNGFDIYVNSYNSFDIPVKIDILEYSNNLVQTNTESYSSQIGKYRYNDFSLSFTGNKLNINYGLNSIRVFLSDSLSETYKDIIYKFVYAPDDVIYDYIAKVEFDVLYSELENTWSVDKLLPLSEDYTSVEDISAYFDEDSTNSQMQIKIPLTYELIYAYRVNVTVELKTTNSDGTLYPYFQYLNWDSTKLYITLEPTLTVDSIDTGFVLMFKYQFDTNRIYTDEIIQKLNGMVHFRIYTEGLDTTDVNYFEEWGDAQFVTTRFQIRTSSTSSVQAASYGQGATTTFVPKFSTTNIFTIKTAHDLTCANFSMGAGATKSLNRTNTYKNIPITLSVNSTLSCSVADAKTTKDSTTQQTSPQIGYIKQLRNFMNQGIYRNILNYYMNWLVYDIFNQYEDQVNQDIYLTYTFNNSTSQINTGFISPQMNSLLNSSGKDSQTNINYAFYYYDYDYTGSNAYSDSNRSTIFSYPNVIVSASYGVESYTSFTMGSSMNYSITINFGVSNEYSMSLVWSIMKEAFILKYHSDWLNSGYMVSRYNSTGVVYNAKYYRYGYYQRLAYMMGNKVYTDFDNTLSNILNNVGFGIEYITNYFMNDMTFSFVINDETQTRTVEELIELYFVSEFERTEVRGAIRSLLNSNVNNLLTDSQVTVTRVYSASLEIELSNLTSELFDIKIYPESISPLYSTFKISNIQLVYNTALASITSLYNKSTLCSTAYKVIEYYGTGIQLSFKYINYTTEEIPVSILISYVDENNYEKSATLSLKLKPSLTTIESSLLSNIIKYGMDTLKMLWFTMIYDQYNEYSSGCEEAMEALTSSSASSSSDVAIANANSYQGSYLNGKETYESIFSQYLTSNVKKTMQATYIEPRMYGIPTYSYSSNVSLVVIPQNWELSSGDASSKMIAQDVVNYIADDTFSIGKTMRGSTDANGSGSLVSYDTIISNYKKKQLDGLGYDINLILVPDTTYNLILRSYLTFTYRFVASGSAAITNLDSMMNAVSGELGFFANLVNFLGLAKIYTNVRDLVEGIMRSFYVNLNFPTYGRYPSAQNPITINYYINNLFQKDYENIINGGSFQEYSTEKVEYVGINFAIPFEQISISIDSTATGIYDMNFLSYSRSSQKTQFVDDIEDMCGVATTVNEWNDKVTVKISAPDVIPDKYISVSVTPLFLTS